MNSLTANHNFENEIQSAQSYKDYLVTNDSEYKNAGDSIKKLSTLKKKIEEWFEPTINQFKKAKQEAENGRKQTVEKMELYTNPVNEVIEVLRSKCKLFENEQIKKAEEEKKKLEQEAKILEKFGDDEAIVETNIKIATTKPELNKVTGLGIRRIWKWRIVDENLIPRHYLIVDELQVNKECRTFQDKLTIPGIEVYYE